MLKNPPKTQWSCTLFGKIEPVFMGLAFTCLRFLFCEVGIVLSQRHIRTKNEREQRLEKHTWQLFVHSFLARVVEQ